MSIKTKEQRSAERKQHNRARAAERQQYIDGLIADVQQSQAGQLAGWNAFCETMSVPMDLYPALMTGRTELLDIIQPRVLNAEECKAMFEVIKGLVKTNHALQAHAQHIAHLVHTWHDAFKHLHSVGDKIEQFANFRPLGGEYEETEE